MAIIVLYKDYMFSAIYILMRNLKVVFPKVGFIRLAFFIRTNIRT